MITCEMTADYMRGTMLRGPRMTAKILGVINNHDQLVHKMGRCLTRYHHMDPPMSEALSAEAQIERRDEQNYTPNAQDAAEGVELLPFQGDTVPPTGPPLAWVLLWRGRYANIYGGYIPVPLKEYGWVVWDEVRLESMGVRKLVAGQWNTAPDLVELIQNHCPCLSYIGEDPNTSAWCVLE